MTGRPIIFPVFLPFRLPFGIGRAWAGRDLEPFFFYFPSFLNEEQE